MLKKNSWIVALLLALSITAFFIVIGCVPALVVEEDNEVYEEYPLDKGYNAWAGQVYQKGWAIGGIKFQGKGDAIVIAKDVGYDIEMFQKATKLKIEMPDASYPRSGVDIIWGGEDENGDSGKAGGMWNQQPIAGGSGDIDTTFAKKDGNVLIIDLQKALKNYSAYTKAAKLKIVMQVNAPSYGDVEGLVQKAFLMIPATPPPTVSISSVAYPSTTIFYTTTGFPLEVSIRPDNATNTKVDWAIAKWVPGKKADGTVADSAAVTLDLSTPLTNTAVADTSSEFYGLSNFAYTKKLLLGRVNWLQEEYVTDENVYPAEKSLRNVIGILTAPLGEKSIGEVSVRVVIKDGYYDKKTGKFSDYTTTKVFNIIEPPKFFYKLSSTDTITYTRNYGAVDNFGIAKGGKMEVVDAQGKPVTNDQGTAYKSTFGSGGSYANSSHYFEVKLGSGKKLENYSGVKLKLKSDDFTLHGKSVRMKAMETPPPNKGYAPGAYVSTTSFTSSDNADANGWWSIEFKMFEDNAKDSDGETKNGIYKKGPTGNVPPADLRLTSTDAVNAAAYAALKDKETIYVWFLPWCGDKSSFIISDVEFIPKP
jgi:hypothetical protein